MRIQHRLNKNNRGFTLVELMIVVAIIGVLAALAIYGVSRYLTNAKSAEARTGVGRIAKDAQSAWERESMAGTVLNLGTSADNSRALCSSSAAVPSDPALIANKKYQSKPGDWKDDGWNCLKFSMDGPQYFQYQYESAGGSAPATTFAAHARGDLDGDSNLSDFSLSGEIKTASGGELALAVSPAIVEDSPEE